MRPGGQQAPPRGDGVSRVATCRALLAASVSDRRGRDRDQGTVTVAVTVAPLQASWLVVARFVSWTSKLDVAEAPGARSPSEIAVGVTAYQALSQPEPSWSFVIVIVGWASSFWSP